MSTFGCKTNAVWPNNQLTIPAYSEFTDLNLVSATAYQTIPQYPVEFGLEPETRIIQVDKEFSALTDWLGNILIQGFED